MSIFALKKINKIILKFVELAFSMNTSFCNNTKYKITIIIKKITKKTTGRYEVVVTNNRGEAKTSTTVSIEGNIFE